MYCYRKVKDDLYFVGANDRRLAMFEGVYSVPKGVSYNSYLLLDEKTVLFDTVDKAVGEIFFENIKQVLGDRKLDYIVVHHMEPDHSATLKELLSRYSDVKIICNAKIAEMIKQFFDISVEDRAIIVNENDTFSSGKHNFEFIMAPMVHWPEVMMTYEATDKILFTADAFGTFGALNGALFSDEVNFERDYLDEARRYYTNIVGKYGPQVQAVLKKASNLSINYICPLHGFVWRKNFDEIINKYIKWSGYEPEEKGVVIAYASIYGHTENAAEILANRLCENGIKTVMFDVSVTPASEIISACFKYSHLVFASATYNTGIFVTMEALLNDLVSHNIQNRVVGFIENGSWAPASADQMKNLFSKCKNINFLTTKLTIKSALKQEQLNIIEEMTREIVSSIKENN